MNGLVPRILFVPLLWNPVSASSLRLFGYWLERFDIVRSLNPDFPVVLQKPGSP